MNLLRAAPFLLAALLATGCKTTAGRVGPEVPELPESTPDERLEVATELLEKGDIDGARKVLGAYRTPATDELRAVTDWLRDAGPRPEPGVLKRRLPWRAIRALKDRVPITSEPWAWLNTRWVLVRVHRGDAPDEIDIERQALLQTLQPDTHARYLAALTRVKDVLDRRQAMAPKRVGVLLPLSGPYGKIGQAARRSIELAHKRSRRVKLLFRDTRGQADVAARWVSSLVEEDSVIGIIGPIGDLESTAAAARAVELGVPLLMLSGREGLSAPSKWLYRARLTASRQGIRIARHAVLRMKLKRFGVLTPDSASGWALTRAFWDEVVRLGGAVSSAVTYAPGSRDFRGIVARLASTGGKRRRAKVDFDGLLVADQHRRVKKFLPFFPYWGIRVRRSPSGRGVQLLGGAGWHHPNVVDLAERQTDNAVFVDSYFADESKRPVKRFVESFYSAYRETPSAFEAEVYDAATLVFSAVRRNRSRTRDGLRERLDALDNVRGVTGRLSFDDDGNVVQDVVILTVDGDRIRTRRSEAEERSMRRGD